MDNYERQMMFQPTRDTEESVGYEYDILYYGEESTERERF